MASALGVFGAALSGLGHGAADQAKVWQDRETDRLKEQRLQEIKRENLGLAEEYDIRGDARGLIHSKALAQQEIDVRNDPANIKAETDAQLQKKRAELGFKTDQANIKAETDAQLQAQAAKDKYEHDRLPEKLADKRLEMDTADPYAGQKAQDQHALVQAQVRHTDQQVEALRNKGGSEDTIKFIDSMRGAIKDDEDAYQAQYGGAPPNPDNVEEVIRANEMRASIDHRRAVLGSIYLLKFGACQPPRDCQVLWPRHKKR